MAYDSRVKYLKGRLRKQFQCVFTLWFASYSVLASIMPSVGLAQSQSQRDVESPIIEHTETGGGELGLVEVFGAGIADNDTLKSVTLHYRFNGETDYEILEMREIASSSFYTAKVDTANVPSDTRSIEYYLRAEDFSGNLVLRGYAFQPLLRIFEPVPTMESLTETENAQQRVIATNSSLEKSVGESKINWLYVGLGLLVAGGIAASLGSDEGGGSTSSENCESGECTVTLMFVRPL